MTFLCSLNSSILSLYFPASPPLILLINSLFYNTHSVFSEYKHKIGTCITLFKGFCYKGKEKNMKQLGVDVKDRFQ